MLNVEGDAFGAGILQFIVDRTEKKEEGPVLTDVKANPSITDPEGLPFIEKGGEWGDQSRADDAKMELSESAM